MWATQSSSMAPRVLPWLSREPPGCDACLSNKSWTTDATRMQLGCIGTRGVNDSCSAGCPAACWDLYTSAALHARGPSLSGTSTGLPAVLRGAWLHEPVSQARPEEIGFAEQEAAQDGCRIEGESQQTHHFSPCHAEILWSIRPCAGWPVKWTLLSHISCCSCQDSTHYEKTLKLLEKYDPDYVPPTPRKHQPLTPRMVPGTPRQLGNPQGRVCSLYTPLEYF
jgi:hypothetical protein